MPRSRIAYEQMSFTSGSSLSSRSSLGFEHPDGNFNKQMLFCRDSEPLSIPSRKALQAVHGYDSEVDAHLEEEAFLRSMLFHARMRKGQQGMLSPSPEEELILELFMQQAQHKEDVEAHIFAAPAEDEYVFVMEL